MDDLEAFHSLVAGIDYPMFVVTAGSGRQSSGCLVGFLTQASIDPPRLMVMISKANHTYRVAAASSELVVHFLHEGNLDLARLYGEETGDQLDKLTRSGWEAVPDVEPPVLRGTRGWVAGRIVSRVDAGDHVGHVMTVERARVDGPPGQLGFHAVRDFQPGHPA
jgi:flavin reductase (DIM6/NTAB) family NADH-FMN oxidoreductase RutF